MFILGSSRLQFWSAESHYGIQTKPNILPTLQTASGRLLVLRLTDLTQTAFADLACDLVVSERLADHEKAPTSTAGLMQLEHLALILL